MNQSPFASFGLSADLDHIGEINEMIDSLVSVVLHAYLAFQYNPENDENFYWDRFLS